MAAVNLSSSFILLDQISNILYCPRFINIAMYYFSPTSDTGGRYFANFKEMIGNSYGKQHQQ